MVMVLMYFHNLLVVQTLVVQLDTKLYNIKKMVIQLKRVMLSLLDQKMLQVLQFHSTVKLF